MTMSRMIDQVNSNVVQSGARASLAFKGMSYVKGEVDGSKHRLEVEGCLEEY